MAWDRKRESTWINRLACRAGATAAKDVVENRRVVHRPAQRADVIERGAEWNHAVGGKFANRRLQADEPARRGRNANRPTRIGSHRGEAHTVGDRCRGSAGGSTRRSIGIVRVSRGSERRVLVGRAKG